MAFIVTGSVPRSSTSGSATASGASSWTARAVASGTRNSIASLRSASLPSIRSRMLRGAFPLRKPGTATRFTTLL